MNKTQTILEDLRQMIQNQSFAGERLPGERELAEKYSCCRGTIRTVLAHLADDGWIERRRKRGTTVRKKNTADDKGSAVLVMRTSGHFYDDLYHEILAKFIQSGYSVLSISTNPVFHNSHSVSSRNMVSLKNAIARQMKPDRRLFVVHTYLCRSIPYFEQLCQYNTILFGSPANCRIHSAHGVWLNFEKAGYLGGRYLIEQGCRRPVYFPNFFSLANHLNPDCYVVHKEKLLIDGFRKAMSEGGINPDTAVINSFSPSPKAHRQILVSLSLLNENMPDGILSTDINISFFIKNLLENHGRIPEELVFAGLYNTPWSRGQSCFPFTSIDFDVAGIAEAVFRMAETPPEKRQDAYVEPKLIIRETANRREIKTINLKG